MQSCVRTRKRQGMPPYLSSPQISSVADRPTDRQRDRNMHGPPVKDFEAQRRVVVFPHGTNLAQTAHERHKCQLVTYFKQCLSVSCWGHQHVFTQHTTRKRLNTHACTLSQRWTYAHRAGQTYAQQANRCTPGGRHLNCRDSRCKYTRRQTDMCTQQANICRHTSRHVHYIHYIYIYRQTDIYTGQENNHTRKQAKIHTRWQTDMHPTETDV